MDNVVFCFSVDPWSSLWKRKQRLMGVLAARRSVRRVFYIEPFSWIGSTGAKGLRRMAVGVSDKLTVIKPVFVVPFSRSIELLHRVNLFLWRVLFNVLAFHYRKKARLVIWAYYPWVRNIIDIKRVFLVYDWTDDWQFSSFSWCRYSGEEEVDILKRADVVFAVSSVLYNRAAKYNKNTWLLPNAVDKRFIDACRKDDSSDIDLNIRRPVLGYAGLITPARMDLALVRFLAEQRKNWSIMLIGPLRGVEKEHLKLLDLPNIYLLGEIPYDKLPYYMRLWDVCILPHLVNELTNTLDPIKLYDYFASGRPVVSTPVKGTERFAGAVETAESYRGFLEKSEYAMRNDTEYKKKERILLAEENTWDKRAEFAAEKAGIK